jgi:uncharacterized protein (DUF58 family)
MTSRAICLALLIVGFAIIGELADWTLLREIGMALVFLLAAAYLWSRISISMLSVERAVNPGAVQVGGVVDDRITVTSAAHLPKFWLEFRDRCELPAHDGSRIFNVRRRARFEWGVQSVAVKRGSYRMSPVYIRASDPFDLCSHERRFSPVADVLVYPPVFSLGGLEIPSAQSTGGPHLDRKTPFLTPVVASVRDYSPGDPFNRISWTASARLGKLMVKEFDLDPTAEIWIIADFGADQFVRGTRETELSRRSGLSFAEAWLDTSEEFVASLAASVAKRAIDHNRSIGLICTSAARIVLPAERSERQYFRTLSSLALANSDGQTPIAAAINSEARRFDRFRSPVVITASLDPAWIDSLNSLLTRRVKPAVLFLNPGSFDPRIDSRSFLRRLIALPFPVHVVDFKEGIEMMFSSIRAPEVASLNVHAN